MAPSLLHVWHSYDIPRWPIRVLLVCKPSPTLNCKNNVLTQTSSHPTMPKRDVAIATVDRCGVWIVWQNGLHRVKINTKKRFGCNRNVHVPCAEQHFVFSMCVTSNWSTPNSLDKILKMTNRKEKRKKNDVSFLCVEWVHYYHLLCWGKPIIKCFLIFYAFILSSINSLLGFFFEYMYSI